MSLVYTIEDITDGVATLRYADGSWAEIILTSDMTEADINDMAYQFRKKTGEAPTFIAEGQQRTAAEKPIEDNSTTAPAWLSARLEAYGSLESQIEYITENGLSAWQTHVAQIKTDNPKPADD